MLDSNQPSVLRRDPWNKGRLIGQKRPLKPKDVWSIRVRLQMERRARNLALFNLAIDSKLRGCDLVRRHCQLNCVSKASPTPDARSRGGDGILPLASRFGSEDPERRARDEMALKVEGVVNGGMHAEKTLGGAS